LFNFRLEAWRRGMAKLSLMLCGFLLLLQQLSGAAQAEEGKELFQKQCAGCHSIGGGDGVGPDLKGVAARRSQEWLVALITDPQRLTAQKDPDQLALVKKFGMQMPKLGVSREDALKMVAFLQGGRAPAQGSAVPAAPAQPPPAAGAPETPQTKRTEVAPTPELISAGKAFFTGKHKFEKGGAPCVSCHTLRYPGVYGGALAGDLSKVYTTMGEGGVRAVLGSLTFPVMRAVYANRPLSEQEKESLVALFRDSSTSPRPACNPYPAAGVGCFVVFIAVATVLKRRIR
jgi:mono/diheme cytochrome c family protein